MNIKAKIGRRIKKLREIKGISQLELSLLAELDRTYINSIENGRRNVSIVNIEKIANACGIERKKGADLEDGSDVEAANSWDAIDVPRFNGVVKDGRVLSSAKADDLKKMPNLIFVLWDETQVGKYDRCRVWVVRTSKDEVFQSVAEKWYKGSKKSSNFQLHPPIGRDDNIVTNKCGNLSLPLLLDARFINGNWVQKSYNPRVLQSGLCKLAESPKKSFSSAKRAL